MDVYFKTEQTRLLNITTVTIRKCSLARSQLAQLSMNQVSHQHFEFEQSTQYTLSRGFQKFYCIFYCILYYQCRTTPSIKAQKCSFSTAITYPILRFRIFCMKISISEIALHCFLPINRMQPIHISLLRANHSV